MNFKAHKHDKDELLHWISSILLSIFAVFYCNKNILAGSPGTVEFSSFLEWNKRGHSEFLEQTKIFMNEKCGNLEANFYELYVLGYFPKIADVNYGIYRYDKGCISDNSCPVFIVTYDHNDQPQKCEYAGHSYSKSGRFSFLQSVCRNSDKDTANCKEELVDLYDSITLNSSIYVEKIDNEKQNPVVEFKE